MTDDAASGRAAYPRVAALEDRLDAFGVWGRFGVVAAQKMRAELAKRPEWAPAPPPGSEKPAKR